MFSGNVNKLSQAEGETLNNKNDSIKDKSSFLFDILKRYDHYVATTNVKASLILSFLGVVIFGLSIRLMFITPADLGCNYLYYATFFSCVVTILTAITSALKLIKVIFPNTTTHNGKKSLIFFGDVASWEQGEVGYAKAIQDAQGDDLLDDLAKQTYIVAEIVNEKFKLLKIAIRITTNVMIPLFAISLLLLILQGAS